MIDARIEQALLATGVKSRVLARQHAEALSSAMEQFEINTPQRMAYALAQFAHETGGWRWLRELGGVAYFKKYEGRQDLGNTYPGDGARFRGRGYIQLTGRTNYAQAGFALSLNLIEHPAQLETPEIAAKVACWWWNNHGLNELADAGDFRKITKRINGGYNGMGDRLEKLRIIRPFFFTETKND